MPRDLDSKKEPARGLDPERDGPPRALGLTISRLVALALLVGAGMAAAFVAIAPYKPGDTWGWVIVAVVGVPFGLASWIVAEKGGEERTEPSGCLLAIASVAILVVLRLLILFLFEGHFERW